VKPSDIDALIDDRPQDGVFRVHADIFRRPDIFEQEMKHLFSARCEHLLVPGNPGWRIRRRKAILLNDTLPTMMDFYTI
jgi:hypothetical protein